MDEVGKWEFDGLIIFIGDDQGYRDATTLRGEINPMLIVALPDDFPDCGMTSLCSKKKKGSVDMAGLGLYCNNGFVFFGAFGAGNKLKRAFHESNGGCHINRFRLKINADPW
jgi:hypothetical protein